MKLRHWFPTIVLTLVCCVAASVPAVGASGAAQGGGNGAVVRFDRHPVVVGSEYQVSGTGFRANTWVTVGAHFADATYWTSFVTGASGGFSYQTTALSPGQIHHEAKEQGRNGSLRLRASATLTVVRA